MNLKEIRTLDNCPEWLKDKYISVANEDIEIKNNKVIWHGGIWNGGTWHDGIWRAGIFNNGVWLNGFWYYGYFNLGVWHDGDWYDGIWENGIWYDGVWHNGIWQQGLWKGGKWLNGYKLIGFSKWRIYYNKTKGRIKIGCLDKTIQDWEKFFNSKKVYIINTEQFNNIYKSYLLAKEAVKLEL